MVSSLMRRYRARGPRRRKEETPSIAFVYDAVYPWVKGGAERRYYELARRLVARGYQVHWYGMKYWDGPRTMLLDGVWYHGVCKPMPLYTRSGRRSISQALVFGLACLRLLTSRCSLIDCCGFPFFSLFSVVLVTSFRRLRLVVTCHEVWGKEYWLEYLGTAGRIGAAVERTALRLPRRVVSVSEDTRQRLLDGIGVRGTVTVIPNGIDTALIEKAAPAVRRSDVLYVGRLCDFKNVELLLHALDLLRVRIPAVTCEIVGDGPDRARLEAAVARLGLAENVTFAGFVEDASAIYARMKGATVLVLPSKREGFGIALLEANAAGVPVIVADYPQNSAKALISGYNGMVVLPTPAALSAAVEKFVADGPGSHREVCRSAVRDYDWESVTTRWEAAVAWGG
jgi:glycosyltransferase involved in cell wall biosynthesis